MSVEQISGIWLLLYSSIRSVKLRLLPAMTGRRLSPVRCSSRPEESSQVRAEQRRDRPNDEPLIAEVAGARMAVGTGNGFEKAAGAEARECIVSKLAVRGDGEEPSGSRLAIGARGVHER